MHDRAPRAPFHEPVAARLSPRRVRRMGRSGQPARRHLRPRRRAQRARFRRCSPRRSLTRIACSPSTCPVAARSEWLADPNDYVFPTYLTVADRADRAKRRRDRRLGRDVDGRPPRHHDGGAAANAGREARRQRRRSDHRACRARAHPRLLRPRPDVRDLRRDRALHPHGVGAVRTAHRRAMGAPHAAPTSASAPTAAGGLAYDPGIAVPFRAAAAPPDLWPLWDAIRCPTLVLRGKESDLLSAATAAHMTARGPRPTLIEFAGVGHAPMLLSTDQIAPVVRFLRGLDLRGRRRRLSRWPGFCFFWPRAAGTIRRHPLQSPRSGPRMPCRSPSACRPLDPRPANPPEIRPAKVFPWLDELLTKDPVEAARVIGDSLAAINRVDDERFEAPRARRAVLGDGGHAVAAARKAVLEGFASAFRARRWRPRRRRSGSRTSCPSRTSTCCSTNRKSASC